MGPNLYSQTPGAFHAGGGYANPFAYQSFGVGNLYGPTQFGDTLGGLASNLPGHALTAGMVASMMPGSWGGGAAGALGNTLGFGAMGMAASIPMTMGAGALAGRVAAGGQRQLYSQGMMQQTFGERDMGGRFGMGVSREGARGFSSAFRELTNSAEMLTSDQEMKSLMTKFSDMKLLQTSKGVSDMATRVKKLSKAVREISYDLGTTLEGAMPDVQRHSQMGFMDVDIMRQSIRTNRALRGAGISMSDSTISGFEMSQAAANFGAGGTRSLGATGAQRTLGEVSVATSQGIIDDTDLMRATGKRGEAGVADLAQQMMQASRNVMQSGYGRNLSAFLGEVNEGGDFTGRIDRDAMKRMRNMSADDILKEAGKKLNKGGATFEAAFRSGLGADISTQLGSGEFGLLLEKMVKTEGQSEAELQLLLQSITGMRGQSIQVLRKVMQDGEHISDSTKRAVRERSIRNRLRSVVERNFTMSGVLDKAYRTYIKDPIFNPVESIGEGIVAGVGSWTDNISEQFVRKGLGGVPSALMGVGMGRDAGTESGRSRISGLGGKTDIFTEMTGDVEHQDILGGAANMLWGTAQGIGAGALAVGSSAIMGTGVGAVIGGAGLVGAGKLGLSGASDISRGFNDITGSRASIINSASDRSRILDRAAAGWGDSGFDIGGWDARGASVRYGMFGERGLTGDREKSRDIELNQIQKTRLIQAARNFRNAPDSDIDDFINSVMRKSNSGGENTRNAMAMAKGGDSGYAQLHALLRDNTLSKEDRAAVRGVIKSSESEVADSERGDLNSSLSILRDEEEAAQDDLNDLIESGGEDNKGLVTDWFGLGSKFSQIESTYMNDLVEKGHYSRLSRINDVLADPKKVEKLRRKLNIKSSDEKIAKVLSEVTGLTFSKDEAASARGLVVSVLKSSTEGAAEFTKRYKGFSQKLKKAILRKRKASLGEEFKFMETSARGILGESGSGGVTNIIKMMSSGQTDEARKAMEDLGLSDEQKSELEGSAFGEVMDMYEGLTTSDTPEGITAALKAKKVKVGEGQSLDQLKNLSMKVAALSAERPDSSTDVMEAMTKRSSPAEMSKLMLELQKIMTADLATTQQTTANFVKVMTDQIIKIKGPG